MLASEVTAAGSLLSCLATLVVLIYCMTPRGRQNSLRHALVVNLCLTEFMNSFNASISGFIYVKSQHLHAGPACSANGFYAQMTEQAVDFTILAMVLGIVLAATRRVRLAELSAPRAKTLICSCIWVVPFITAVAAVAMHAFKPVGSNWCDITNTTPGLRYALADGWRLAIMFFTVCSYAFIWWSPRRRQNSRPLAHCRKQGEKDTTRNKTRWTSNTSAFAKIRSLIRTGKRRSWLSSILLPFQERDASDVDLQERPVVIDDRTEGISPWIYVRQPGPINSSRTPLRSSSIPLESGAVSTQSVPITTDRRDWAAPRVPLPPHLSTSLGARQHGQIPKTQRMAKAPADPKSSAVSSRADAVPSKARAPRRHKQSSKSIASADTHTASSKKRGPWDLHTLNNPRWPFLTSTSSHSPSSSGSSAGGTTPEAMETKHVRRPTTALLEANEQLRVLSSTMESPRNSKSTEAARSSKQAAESHVPPEDSSSPRLHSTFGASVHAPDDQKQRRPRLTPYPKVESTSKASCEIPRGLAPPRPKYHSETPLVRKSITITSSEPAFPQSAFGVNTRIYSASYEPPPPPIPGLPAPPWSTDSKKERLKTFLRSRSTRSDTTAPDAGTTVAENEREIRRMLLLNAYTVAYVVLRLPWMVNVFMEACGTVAVDAGAMAALVGLSQYLGLVHATTFAVNEGLVERRQTQEAPPPSVRVFDEKRLLDIMGV